MWIVKLTEIIDEVIGPTDKLKVKVTFENTETSAMLPREYTININEIKSFDDLGFVTHEDLANLNSAEQLKSTLATEISKPIPEKTKEEYTTKKAEWSGDLKEVAKI